MKTLVVTAHPDDETLFAYSYLVENDCLVVCLTNKSNPVRSKEFGLAAQYLDTEYEMFDFPDVWDGDFPQEEVSNIIKDYLSTGLFDRVLTHNEVGEYGHTQHKSLYQIADSLVSNNLYTFGHIDNPLSFSRLQGKIFLLGSVYKSQADLNTYDWYSSIDPDIKMIRYVSYEGIRKIK